MKTERFQFGEFLPDAPDGEHTGLTQANNVYPTAGGYGPFAGTVATGVTVTGQVFGAKRFRRSDGTEVTCIGTAADLFVVTGGAANASSLSLTVTAGNFWEFEQFGALIIAVCPGQTTYYLTDLDSDIVFSALLGSPPKARTVDRVGEFLMLGNVNDGTAYPYRLQWSAYNSPTASWTTSIGAQSGLVDMPPQYGEVTAIAGKRWNLVFQRYAVSRIEQIGGVTVFGKREIEEKRGCIASPSVVAVGATVYFLAHDGFCSTDGSSVVEIGTKRVNDWFLSDVDGTKIEYTQGAINWQKKCVIWSYIPSGETTYTKQIIYSWQENRWSTAALAVDWMVETETSGILIDTFDAAYGNSSADDPIVASKLLDSEEFSGGDMRFGAWYSSGANSAEADMSGSTLEALFETGEFQPMPGERSFVGKVRPLVENILQNTTVAIGKRNQFKGGPITYTAAKTVGPDGGASVRSDGRWQRVQIIVPKGANWDKASGFEAEVRPSGAR